MPAETLAEKRIRILARYPLALPTCGLLLGQAMTYPLLWSVWPCQHLGALWICGVSALAVSACALAFKRELLGRCVPFCFLGIGLSMPQLLPAKFLSGEHAAAATVISMGAASPGKRSAILHVHEENQTNVDQTTVVRCTFNTLPWRNAAMLEAGQQLLLRATFSPLLLSPNPFAYDNSQLRQGLRGSCKVLQAGVPWRREVSAARALREDLAARVHTLPISRAARASMLAMTLGDDEQLSAADRALWKDTGLMHLLVVSGFQVSGIFFVALGAMKFATRLFQIPRWLPAICAYAVALAYVLILEFPVAGVRALLTLLIFVISTFFERRLRVGDGLWSGIFLMSVIWPGCMFEPGPELTFAALLAIGAGQHPLGRGSLLRGLWISTLATFATSLVSLCWFGRFSLAGFFLNPILAPLLGGCGCALISALLAGLYVAPALAAPLLILAGRGIEELLELLRSVQSFPGTVLIAKENPLLLTGSVGILLAALIALHVMRHRARANLADFQ